MNADRQPNDLERLWEATRPSPPSAEAWDRAWASIAGRIDEPAPATFAMPPSRRRWAAIGLVLLAQAAAVFLAVRVVLDGPDPDAGDVSRTATAAVRIEEGQLVLIRTDADAIQITDLTPRTGGAGVDAWYLVHNHFESTPGPFIAMAE